MLTNMFVLLQCFVGLTAEFSMGEDESSCIDIGPIHCMFIQIYKYRPININIIINMYSFSKYTTVLVMVHRSIEVRYEKYDY